MKFKNNSNGRKRWWAWKLNQSQTQRAGRHGLAQMGSGSGTRPLTSLHWDLARQGETETRVSYWSHGDRCASWSSTRVLNAHTAGAGRDCVKHIVVFSFGTAPLWAAFWGALWISDVLTCFPRAGHGGGDYPGGVYPLTEFAAKKQDNDIP